MRQETGKFELSLSFGEVLFLFFVMIFLFTALLIFGYRVGYTQNLNARRLQPRPVAPAEERPAIQIEPELRMENLAPAEPELWPVSLESAEPVMAQILLARSSRPCSTSPVHSEPMLRRRLFGLLSGLASVTSPDGHTWRLPAEAGQMDSSEGNCRPVKYWRASPSLAC